MGWLRLISQNKLKIQANHVMSKYVNSGNISENSNNLKLTIKDTEFLLRLLSSSTINGTDVLQCADTLTKLKYLHSQLMEKTVEVI